MYTLEYNSNQKAFHIDDLKSIIEKNIKKYFRNIPSEWELLGIFDNYEDANRLREMVEYEKTRLSSTQKQFPKGVKS